MPQPHTPTRSVAIALALLVTVLWSTSWIVIRWGLDDESLDPLGFAALRYSIAAVAVSLWVLRSGSHRAEVMALDRRSVVRIGLLGLVLYGVTQGAQFVAIDNQPAATTSLVLSATPLVIAMVSQRTLQEAPSASQILGGVLVIGGAMLYFGGSLGATRVGFIAATVGLIANSTAAIMGRSVNRSLSVSPAVVTAASMTVGSGALLVVALVVEGWPTLTLRGFGLIVWLALVNTALAFTIWNLSLRRLSALESAGINNTMLLQIAVLAWWLLGENPGSVGLLGIAVTSAGILLTQTNNRRRPA